MSSYLLIYLTAKGWLRFLPSRWRRPLARRSLRSLMAMQGVPLDGLTDQALDVGAGQLAALVDTPTLAMAASLRDLIRDSEPRP